jgi:shikimate dehydrogenase
VPDQFDRAVELLRGAVARRLAGRGQKTGDILVGLVGRAIQSSRSPIMHEREAARLGIACSYLLIDFDALGLADAALDDVLKAAAMLGFAGCNVTHPFKQQILPHLDALSAEARAIGAVNTVVFEGARTTGYNTDAWGFAQSFRDNMRGVALDRVVQFGAGGAGAAVAHALLELGVKELILIDSDPARAEALAQRFGVKSSRDVATALAAADGIVNATPMGMEKYPGLPFPAALLRPSHWVAEIVYFPAETELLRQARNLGCRSLSGIGMAIGQAARAFELFTGRKPDPKAMAGHFEAAA